MRTIDADALNEIGTTVLPITYDDVKNYSDNLFALLDALKEVKKNEID